VRLWFPVLTGLGRLVANDPRVDLRGRAMEELFGVLKAHGGGFSEEMWLLVYQGVLYPIFDDVIHMGEVSDTEWLRTTCGPAMAALTSVFSLHFAVTSRLLDLHLSLLGKCVGHVNETVAEIGVSSVRALLAESGAGLTREHWGVVCDVMRDMFDRSGPMTEEELGGEGSVEGRLQRVASRHRVRMMLFRLVQDMCGEHCERIGPSHVMRFLNLLGSTQHSAMARSFASVEDSRESLGQVGAAQYLQMVYAESAEASRSELRFMFSVYAASPEDARQQGEVAMALETRLMDRAEEVLNKYTGLDRELKAIAQRASSGAGAPPPPDEPMEAYTEQIRLVLCPTVVVIAEGLMGLSQGKFDKALPAVFPLLCALVECSDQKVRSLVASLFLHKIGPSLGIAPKPQAQE